MRTWLRRRALLALPLIAFSTPPARAQSSVRIAVDVDARTFVQLSIEAALRRMTELKCQQVFESFSIVVPAGDPAPIWVVDAGESAMCGSPGLAFMSLGSRVVHLCRKRFRETFPAHRGLAEAIIIHEILHMYGLGENPPSSGTITARVVEECILTTVPRREGVSFFLANRKSTATSSSATRLIVSQLQAATVLEGSVHQERAQPMPTVWVQTATTARWPKSRDP